MPVHIIIDGYNLIRNYPPLSRVEAVEFSKGRESLLEWLSIYRRGNSYPITVIFDGGKGGGATEERDMYKGIKILYSRLGQTADEVIKRVATKEREKVLVVTSDLELSNYCRSQRAGVIRSEDFTHKIQEKKRAEANGGSEEENSPALPKRKKGASYRLSKKAKKDRKYWDYL
jgi:uncharacterized protein